VLVANYRPLLVTLDVGSRVRSKAPS
jgi:hypothetical protein